jgi:putative ABC transport system ATP-binding protein
MTPTVAVRQVNYTFGKGALSKRVLNAVDFDILPGEIVILMGPSGGGKTTLLTLIGALRSMQEGSLKILDQELMGARKKQLIQVRNQIGFIFQNHNLLNCLTAQQNVRMSLKLHSHIPEKERDRRTVEILTAVGLEPEINKYPQNLSGGQKQRVAIARALVAHPKLVLADEPTSALDSKSGRDVVNILQRLAKEEHCAVLIVTHDNRILDIADRIVHMEDGQLLEKELLAP